MGTDGYGGRNIRETVRIKTNDPNRLWIQAVVTGMVEKFAEIRSERVLLPGPAETQLFAEVEIVSRNNYPFKILEIKVKRGTYIRYSLTERCTDGKNRCVIRVENTRTDKGRYVDALFVDTDSKIRSTIPIYITGMIQ